MAEAILVVHGGDQEEKSSLHTIITGLSSLTPSLQKNLKVKIYFGLGKVACFKFHSCKWNYLVYGEQRPGN